MRTCAALEAAVARCDAGFLEHIQLRLLDNRKSVMIARVKAQSSEDEDVVGLVVGALLTRYTEYRGNSLPKAGA